MITISDKAKKLINKLNPKNFFVVTDFDRTITEAQSLSSWAIMPETDFFDKGYKEESNKFFKYYYAIENDFSISKEDKFKKMIEWWEVEILLFQKYNVTIHDLISIGANKKYIKLRQGIIQFIRFTNKHDIPFIILSAGIGEMIASCLKKHGVDFDNVKLISNFMKIKNNKIIDFSSTIIHSQNKNDFCNIFLKKINTENRPYVLLFGDNIEDVNMVPHEMSEKTIKIGFYEGKKTDMNKYNEGLEKFQQRYDIVCTDNTSFTELFEKLGIKSQNEILNQTP